MSNRVHVSKIGKSMLRFEKSVEYLNRKIDERSRNGKHNEDDDVASRHFTGIADDGSRCWSF